MHCHVIHVLFYVTKILYKFRQLKKNHIMKLLTLIFHDQFFNNFIETFSSVNNMNYFPSINNHKAHMKCHFNLIQTMI